MSDPCLARGFPALLAAVLPEVVGQSAKRAILGGVIVKCALLATHEQPSAQQAFQVMAECRGGQIDVGLDLTSRPSDFAALHDEAEDRQPHGVTERRKLVRVMFELVHSRLFLVFSKHSGE